jgi:DNA-binding LacI/PurR family transcriptional regulator
MNVTLTDIANHAGCSPATVSRALNGTAGVDARLHARIVAAVKVLESPGCGNAPRRGRPRGSLRKSDAVDVIVFRREAVEPLTFSDSGLTVSPITDAEPNVFFSPRFRLATDFYRHIIDGIVSVLATAGLKTIQQVRNDLLEINFLHELRTARHRGVLLLGEPDPQVQTFADTCGCPVVLVDILGVAEHPVVAIDNAGGVAQSLRHLLELGHRDIGFAGTPDNPSLRERFLAYCGGMTEAGLTVRSDWRYGGVGHIRDVADGVRHILGRKRRPSAFLCAGDYYALGVLEAARSLGLRVPQDLSVAGFDDVDAAALSTPPLTTVRVPKIQLGACAADLLLRCGAGDGNPEIWQHCEVRCRTELAVRASAAPLSNRIKQRKTI